MISTSSPVHIANVLSVRAAVVVRLKSEPDVSIYGDVIEPMHGYAATLVPWGTLVRLRVHLDEIAAADVAQIAKFEKTAQIARAQRARFAPRREGSNGCTR